ncbi:MULTISPECIES: cytochrome d ubiquinol oxidase subunit II [Subtercola]|uniref:Cytochrome d ubiquinol oxidase subunit II n=1 Tax=Subtercola vilae TaxID=2056433 RepID=A0A4T2C8Q4_9MICO|nr:MULTISPECIES: cytochrome d ubiquinol oxidase subunit II [Subtercola]MEA9983822.1 cytochrome d ubiquinol oxidase subunit II [Subtercola sp. RTI3]TIH40637.1 cytochrome d ubiquinol oxidase subunit II [Subtercola vilae]
MDALPTIWFIAIAALWIGYLLLEGFDLGVGMHMLFTARTDTERRVMLNSIGPVWDGNEVWLITAGAATFAAFPLWYASLFSSLYLPLTIVLVGLIFRAVAIEYRGKGTSVRWTGAWDRSIGVGSLIVAFGIGAALALTTTGLPINANGDRVGGAFAWFTGYAVLGGFAVVGFCLVHGAVFLALKTDGTVRQKANRFVTRWAPIALLPIVGWVLAVQFTSGRLSCLLLIAGAVVAVSWAWISARRGSEGKAFLGLSIFLVLGAASIFANVFPVLLPSTIDSAFSLTTSNAASGSYTLSVMTVVTAIGLPLVLVYQGWTYWVFRKRISDTNIPAAHTVVDAVRT